MPKKSFEQLSYAAKQIRDEYLDRQNTANRVGSLFEDIIDSILEGTLNEKLLDQVLRKDKEDATNFLVTFFKGLLIGDNGSGITVLKDGTSQAVVDRLYVKVKAYFEELEVQRKSYVGGSQALTPSGMKCVKVEELDDCYRCYIKAEEEGIEVVNTFTVGTLAMMKECNISVGVGHHAGNRYFWREVTNVGPDYIDVSKTKCDPNSENDIPAAGDDIVGLGHRTDLGRQGAIVMSSVDEGAPSIIFYQGINDFTLTDKAVIEMSFDKATGLAKLNVYGSTYIGKRDKSSYFKFDPVNGAEFKGKVIIRGKDGKDKELSEEMLEAAAAAADAQKRLDEWAKDGVISPLEKSGLLEEIARIDSDHANINASYEKYKAVLGEPTAYNTAYAEYREQLVALSAKEPETIPIPADFAANTTTYYTERTNALNAIFIASDNKINDAKKDAADAKKRLDEWAKDGVISPLEKQGLKEEIVRIDSDYQNIVDGFQKFYLGQPSAYIGAYQTYRAQLVTLSADKPETITIPSDFGTNMEHYYAERTAAMNAMNVVLQVGSVNLLRNTGFTGDYKPMDMSDAFLDRNTEVYSPPLTHWNGSADVVNDSSSASGKAAILGSISQNVYLQSGDYHTVSFKAKGSYVTVGTPAGSRTIYVSGSYARYSHTFIAAANSTISFSGSATICEIKLERGIVATDWCPAREDSNKIADEFRKLWYLLDALDGMTTIDGGLVLTSVIRLGQWRDGVLQKVNGAISGIYNNDNDVFACAGGDLDKAINTVAKFQNNPSYQPTAGEMQAMCNFVVTHGGLAILNNAIVRGCINATSGVFRNISSPNGNFMVDEDGDLWATNAYLSGVINAEGGTFRNIQSPNGNWSIDYAGNVTTKGVFASPWFIYSSQIGGIVLNMSMYSNIRISTKAGYLIDIDWSTKANGREIKIWIDYNCDPQGCAIRVPENKYLFREDGSQLRAGDIYVLPINTITFMCCYQRGWIVTKVMHLK